MSLMLLILLQGCAYNNLEDVKNTDWTYLNTSNSKLSSDNVSLLKIDSKGNVWAICGSNYLNKIKPDLSIEVFEIPFSDSLEQIWELAIDKLDRVWIGCNTSPLFCFDGMKWEKLYYNNYRYAPVMSIDFDENNKLWFGSNRYGLFKQINNNFINFNFYNSNIASSEVFKILVKNSSAVYLTTQITPPISGTESTLSFFDGNTFRVIAGENDTSGLFGSGDLLLNDNKVAALTSKGIFELEGLNIKKFGTNASYINYPKSPYGFNYDAATGYWIMSNLGLYNCSENYGKLCTTENTGLPTNTLLSSLLTDLQNNMFIGTRGKGIAIFKLTK